QRTDCHQQLARIIDDWQAENAMAIREHCRQRFLEHVRISGASSGTLDSEQKEFKKLYGRGRRELEHEFGKSMRYKAIRELAAGDSGIVVRDLKPVWLMSPLSVSDTLPLASDLFDVVIFDEASQINLEEAVPSLFRAAQTIVVGDEMQLPPTSFFATSRDDEDEIVFDEDGESFQYDLNSNSFLNHAARNLASRMLGWHYRSRSERLISFSNHAFYGGKLLTVPDELLASQADGELIAESAQDAVSAAEKMPQRPVSFHFLTHGIYENRRNTAEAEYIAELVRCLLRQPERRTIGIIAFSEAQQDEIERALRRLAAEDRLFAEELDAELEREEDGQFCGLLVKNLENIQGDERDVIIMSVCYGPDPHGKVRMNFGPINQAGGEKRLNVAFSRAKHLMALVTSMRSAQITNDYNDGAACLKNYLKYAEACSAGQADVASLVLRGLSGVGTGSDRSTGQLPHTEPLIQDIAEQLRQHGYKVHTNVGQSHFRCDLAVYREGDPQYRLGILTDSQHWYDQTDLVERELTRPALLKTFGWHIQLIHAADWYADRDTLLQSLLQQLDSCE
ncbi:MAG: hypothetical protein KDA96_22670, partial [Planctomycetaceae bacterium]|nr:hypothetical protein [Planctomycetaceae bacterium]